MSIPICQCANIEVCNCWNTQRTEAMTATTKPVDISVIAQKMLGKYKDRLDMSFAFAELIAADVEYDEARAAYPNARLGDYAAADEYLTRTKERRAAALAAIQGENVGGGS